MCVCVVVVVVVVVVIRVNSRYGTFIEGRNGKTLKKWDIQKGNGTTRNETGKLEEEQKDSQ